MNEMCLEESYSVTHLQNGATQRTLTSLHSTAAKRNNVYIYY